MSPERARGERRRRELVAAGVELLAESGWSGLTHRAVAARANANAGLVHYYFNGTDGLRLAVATVAASDSITAVLDQVLTARTDSELVDAVGNVLSQARHDSTSGRVTAELVSAAFADPAIAEVVRRELARGRERVEEWLVAHHAELTPAGAHGVAAVIVAAVDGLALHLVLDPDLRVPDLRSAVARWGGPPTSATDEERSLP